MRLIDADALMDIINNIPSSMSVCLSMDECKGMKYMKEKAYMAVFQAPTIDAVPVVRCGECDHRYDGNCPLQIDHGEMPDDWFCKDGERREG